MITQAALSALIVSLLLIACTPSEQPVARWYSGEQAQAGAGLFATHCASCHGAQAQGLVKDWKRTGPDGFLPPPPLNGSAHAWHHPLPLLLEIVQQGGARYNGKMQGFANTLSEPEQYAVIAWFQSLWSDDIYRAWQQRGAPSALQSPSQSGEDKHAQ